MEEPPEHYVCPITLGIMSDPILVTHAGSPFWFDRRSLELHSQTEHFDRNPLTNTSGFSQAKRVSDQELKAEIMASKWKDNIEAARPDLENPGTPDDDDWALEGRRTLFPGDDVVADVAEAIWHMTSMPRPEQIMWVNLPTTQLDSHQVPTTPDPPELPAPWASVLNSALEQLDRTNSNAMVFNVRSLFS